MFSSSILLLESGYLVKSLFDHTCIFSQMQKYIAAKVWFPPLRQFWENGGLLHPPTHFNIALSVSFIITTIITDDFILLEFNASVSLG